MQPRISILVILFIINNSLFSEGDINCRAGVISNFAKLYEAIYIPEGLCLFTSGELGRNLITSVNKNLRSKLNLLFIKYRETSFERFKYARDLVAVNPRVPTDMSTNKIPHTYWGYHVVLEYGKDILDLDLPSGREKGFFTAREYFPRMFPPLLLEEHRGRTRAEDVVNIHIANGKSKTVTHNSDEEIVVISVPISEYLALFPQPVDYKNVKKIVETCIKLTSQKPQTPLKEYLHF